MKALSSQELAELRADLSPLCMSDAEAEELIRLIDNIVISIVEQNRGLHPVQLSLAARANRAFAGESDHAKLCQRGIEDGDLDHEGATNADPKWSFEPR